MLSIYTVSFFGHRILRNPMQAEKHIETLVRKLICEKEYVEFFDSNNSVHPKSAFKKRNEVLLKRSDLAIFWVENNYGGAYSSLQYAKAHNIKNINLAEIET